MAKSTKSNTYAFEAENFPFITLQENLNETWNTLGLNDLQVIEQEGLINLLSASGMTETNGFDPNRVLLVKASGGFPQVFMVQVSSVMVTGLSCELVIIPHLLLRTAIA